MDADTFFFSSPFFSRSMQRLLSHPHVTSVFVFMGSYSIKRFPAKRALLLMRFLSRTGQNSLQAQQEYWFWQLWPTQKLTHTHAQNNPNHSGHHTAFFQNWRGELSLDALWSSGARKRVNSWLGTTCKCADIERCLNSHITVYSHKRLK